MLRYCGTSEASALGCAGVFVGGFLFGNAFLILSVLGEYLGFQLPTANVARPYIYLALGAFCTPCYYYYDRRQQGIRIIKEGSKSHPEWAAILGVALFFWPLIALMLRGVITVSLRSR